MVAVEVKQLKRLLIIRNYYPFDSFLNKPILLSGCVSMLKILKTIKKRINNQLWKNFCDLNLIIFGAFNWNLFCYVWSKQQFKINILF